MVVGNEEETQRADKEPSVFCYCPRSHDLDEITQAGPYGTWHAQWPVLRGRGGQALTSLYFCVKAQLPTHRDVRREVGCKARQGARMQRDTLPCPVTSPWGLGCSLAPPVPSLWTATRLTQTSHATTWQKEEDQARDLQESYRSPGGPVTRRANHSRCVSVGVGHREEGSGGEGLERRRQGGEGPRPFTWLPIGSDVQISTPDA
jgi:hypothetical protein